VHRPHLPYEVWQVLVPAKNHCIARCAIRTWKISNAVGCHMPCFLLLSARDVILCMSQRVLTLQFCSTGITIWSFAMTSVLCLNGGVVWSHNPSLDSACPKYLA
jgi:hypothetical protein